MKNLVLGMLVLAAGCRAGLPGLHDVVVTHPAPGCDVTTGDADDTTAGHRTACEPLTYDTEPPCHGDHYGIWANFGTYAAPVPWPFLVHDMEHGGVVLAYRPGPAIPDAATKLQAFVDAYPADAMCTSQPWRTRLIVVPDPTLDVPVAAAAWRHVYRATCWDEASLRAFVDAHYAMAPEDFCFGGTDGSATGWCPPP